MHAFSFCDTTDMGFGSWMTGKPMLQPGDSIPHFEVKTLGGELFSYSTVWQRRNLVLLAIPAAESEAPGAYLSRLVALRPELTAKDAECVVTRDRVPGIQSPAVVVADKWGEIVHVATASQVDHLTSPQELLDWVEYLDRRCPECEGEAR
jgi:peroxiredoxin